MSFLLRRFVDHRLRAPSIPQRLPPLLLTPSEIKTVIKLILITQ